MREESSGNPQPPSHAQRRRTLLLVTLLHAFTHFYPSALLPLYLLIQTDLHLARVATATLLGTMLSLSYCLTSLPLGILADQLSRKRILGIGLFLNGLAFVAIALSPNYWMVVAGAIFAGIAGGFYHPAATALVFGLYPNHKGKAIGFAGTGAALGFFLGPVYAGLRGEVCGWRQACLEMGLAGMAVALLFAVFAEEVVATSSMRDEFRQRERPFPAVLWPVILVGIAFSLRDFGATGLATLTSLFLQKVHRFGEARTGFILGLMSLPAIAANPLFGALSEGKHRLRWLTFLLIVAGVCATTIPWLPRAGVVWGLLTFQFFLLATYPVMESSLADTFPDAIRGRVTGVYLASAGCVGSSAPWVMGLMTDRLKHGATQPSAYAPVYAILGLLIIAALTGVALVRWLKTRRAVHALWHAS